MNICIIPARGGSKRIPKKNIKLFNGKPIIAYSIETAISSQCFDDVIVSTDSEDIATVAKKYGATVPFIRPKELSDYVTGTMAVTNHAIDWCIQNLQKPDFVCCLYATAPFVTTNTLQDSFQALLKSKKNYCFSMTSFPYPIQRALKMKNEELSMFYPEYLTARSQDLEESYHDAGQFYWGRTDAFLNKLPTFSQHAQPFILPRYLVQDIDTLEDWQTAEYMHKSITNN